jgi:glycosidase
MSDHKSISNNGDEEGQKMQSNNSKVNSIPRNSNSQPKSVNIPLKRDNPAHQVEKSLKQINLSALTDKQRYYPSPITWEDEVLYFLLVDRFSDGREHNGFSDGTGKPITGPGSGRTTPLFNLEKDAERADRENWFKSGQKWCGGTIAGLHDKLGYLQRLGITTVWLSPVFRQMKGSDNYHGYGIQNFLDIDPHFGSREDLIEFVAAAHEHKIRVILDIILNHAGDIFAYKNNDQYGFDQGQQWPVNGFRQNSHDPGSIPFAKIDTNIFPDAWPGGGIWPVEFQDPNAWTRKGAITHWDGFPDYLDGDFCSLKDLDHGIAPKQPEIAWDVQKRIRDFQASQTLLHLAEVYKFWIGYADIDGYRIDTVKHMEPGAVRFFANVIHEFAQSIGKENFYLIGEVTGGRAHAVNILNTTGIDAALGINEIPDKLEFLVKGWRSPGNPSTDEQEGYFDMFRNSLLDHKHTHQWFGKHVVTMFDDHDQVGTQHKFRFCGQHADSFRFLAMAIGLNLTTTGIPCIYYGTEQGFNGADHREKEEAYSDVFLRECMFGGPFGSLQSTGRHFFNEEHQTYRFIQDLCSLRKKHIALRRGRQYLRQVEGSDGAFHVPQPVDGELRWVIAWSRIFADREYVCAINTDANQPLTLRVTVDYAINPPDTTMSCLFSTDSRQEGKQVRVEKCNGSAVNITVPPAGFVVYR